MIHPSAKQPADGLAAAHSSTAASRRGSHTSSWSAKTMMSPVAARAARSKFGVRPSRRSDSSTRTRSPSGASAATARATVSSVDASSATTTSSGGRVWDVMAAACGPTQRAPSHVIITTLIDGRGDDTRGRYPASSGARVMSAPALR
jgi:hypothetical protein